MKQSFFLSAVSLNPPFAHTKKLKLQDTLAVEFIKANYLKIEKEIPMRDGIKLHTVIYSPKDCGLYPILLHRTPYSAGPYGESQYRSILGPSWEFVEEGYIFVYQDVRGRYLSEGEFVANRPYIPVKENADSTDESSDSYDTISWLTENLPGNNGKVGTWGISSPGFYTTMTTIDSHPALKAASPQAPVTDWFMGDDRHHNGAFLLQGTFSFLSYFGTERPKPTAEHAAIFDNYDTPDAYIFFKKIGPISNINEFYFKGKNKIWNEMMDHPDYTYFWKIRSPLPHLKNTKPAVLIVGGWFDQEDLYGPLKTYTTIEENQPKSPTHLVMGPWTHGSWSRGENSSLGNIRFNSATGPYYRAQIELPFFNYHLKDKPDPCLPKATIFETGSNLWKKYSSWPPATAITRKLYFLPGGLLSFNESDVITADYDEYISDPENPVPYTNQIRIDRGSDFMYEDQRFASRRPDVLVYKTAILIDDVIISGKLLAELFVSTTGTDADFVVKLIDVLPGNSPDDSPIPGTKMGGFEQLVRGEVMRSKYRNSFSKPQPMEPGLVTPVNFDMQDAAHCFKKGHQIMIQIQSSWFPLIDINPQSYVNIYQAEKKDFCKSIIRIFSKPGQRSGILMDVILNEKSG